MNDINDIWTQANELGSLIAESPEVKEYKIAQVKMESNPEIKSLLNRLRDAQTEYSRLESYGSGPHLKELETSVNDLLSKLDQFQEVVDFKQASAKIDELLRSVTTVLSKCITEEINGNTSQNSSGCKD